MTEGPAPRRWRAALARAARATLADRWRGTLEALEAARHEYRSLRAAGAAASPDDSIGGV